MEKEMLKNKKKQAAKKSSKARLQEEVNPTVQARAVLTWIKTPKWKNDDNKMLRLKIKYKKAIVGLQKIL